MRFYKNPSTSNFNGKNKIPHELKRFNLAAPCENLFEVEKEKVPQQPPFQMANFNSGARKSDKNLIQINDVANPAYGKDHNNKDNNSNNIYEFSNKEKTLNENISNNINKIYNKNFGNCYNNIGAGINRTDEDFSNDNYNQLKSSERNQISDMKSINVNYKINNNNNSNNAMSNPSTNVINLKLQMNNNNNNNLGSQNNELSGNSNITSNSVYSRDLITSVKQNSGNLNSNNNNNGNYNYNHSNSNNNNNLSKNKNIINNKVMSSQNIAKINSFPNNSNNNNNNNYIPGNNQNLK